MSAEVGVGVVPRILVVLEDVEARGLRETAGEASGVSGVTPRGACGAGGDAYLGVFDLQRAAPGVNVGPVEGRLGSLGALHRVKRWRR